MLWARVISEAVRTVAPEIVAGTYTPEETHDFAEEAPQRRSWSRTAHADDGREGGTGADVVDAQFVVVQIPNRSTAAKCTAEQRTQLKSLFDACGAQKEQIDKAMEKRGVKAMRYLTSDQANELIDALTARAPKAVETVGESRLPDDTRTSDVTAPVGSTLVDDIKTLLKDDLG